VTGDGDRSRRRCAGRGARLPAGAGRRWARCPHPPGVERRAPSSRSSRDSHGRTAATTVSAMMARPSDPPDVSGVDQTRCRGPEHHSRAMRSGPTRSGICRVGPDRTRRASARGARRLPFAIWCRLQPAGARSHGEQSSPARRSRLVTPGPRTPCASASKQIPAATGSTALPSRRAFSVNSLISSAPHDGPNRPSRPQPARASPVQDDGQRSSTSRASDLPKTGNGSQTDPGPVLTPLGTDSHPSAEGPPGRGRRRRRRPQAGPVRAGAAGALTE
jgi:hypothetical protein